MARRRFRNQAHPIPVTLGDAWDEARRNPRQTAIDLAVALLVIAAGWALVVVMAGGMQQ